MIDMNIINFPIISSCDNILAAVNPRGIKFARTICMLNPTAVSGRDGAGTKLGRGGRGGERQRMGES